MCLLPTHAAGSRGQPQADIWRMGTISLAAYYGCILSIGLKVASHRGAGLMMKLDSERSRLHFTHRETFPYHSNASSNAVVLFHESNQSFSFLSLVSSAKTWRVSDRDN